MGVELQPRAGLCLSALLSFLAGAVALPAQQGSAIHGVVADESTWRLISSARVTLVETGAETLTNHNGTFVFPNPPLGRVSIRVEAPGFPTMVEEVEVTADASLFVQFVLPQVGAVLDEILVLARGNRPRGDSGEPQTAADLLAMEIRGVKGNRGMVGADDAAILLRGVGSMSLPGDPVLFLDGVRMSGGPGEALAALELIPASEIRDIRIFRGPAGAFLRGSADGVIEVRTKSGRDR